MSERTTVLERPQLGVETTSGTAVAADRRIGSLTSFGVTPNLAFDTHLPAGNKTAAGVMPTREWSDIRAAGVIDYEELTWWLSSMLGGVTPAQQAATAAYKWTWADTPLTEVVPKSMTFEDGSAARAQEIAYGVVTGLDLNFPANASPSLSFTGIGRALTDGVTITGSLDDPVPHPALRGEVNVYLDDDAASLGTTKLTRNFSAKVRFPPRFGPFWTNNTANGVGFAGLVEVRAIPMVELTVEADSTGMGLLTPARAGTTKFVRIECAGPNIESTYDYTLLLDFAVQISALGAQGDSEGIYAQPYTMTNVYDPTWGQSFGVELTNELTAI